MAGVFGEEHELGDVLEKPIETAPRVELLPKGLKGLHGEKIPIDSQLIQAIRAAVSIGWGVRSAKPFGSGGAPFSR